MQKNIRNLLDFFRIHISLSKKMELVFTFWHKIFNSYLINQTKPWASTLAAFFVFIPSFNKESIRQDNPILLFSPIHSKTILQHQLTASTFSPAYLVRKHHISKNQKSREKRERLKIRVLHIIKYAPLLLSSMCSTKDGGHIYFSPLLTLR